MSQSVIAARGVRPRRIAYQIVMVAALLLANAWGTPACAAGVPAGRNITNVASLRYDIDGAQQTVASNAVTLAVAERLDLTLERVGSGPVTIASGATAVPLVLTNTGNGSEAFLIDAVLAAGDSRVRLVAIDADGDGRFDPALDGALTDGRTPLLAPGASLRLLAVFDTPATATAGSLTLAARAITASGQPGTTAAGQGDDGSDAVVGPTGAAASVTVPLVTATAGPTLVKSQRVVAPDGSASAVRGAIITYTLVAAFPGETATAAITDPIPAGTAYAPGSLTLDGTAMTDVADGDAGEVAADEVTVALGTVAGPATHTIRFNVIIQ